MIKKIVAFAILALFSHLTFANEAEWKTNFEEAKTAAAKENKDILLEFTGSDWCMPCKMLHAEILTNPVFLEFAKRNFILVELDFPKKKEIAPALLEQNKKLFAQFGVQGYPTILLCDKNGLPYASLGYSKNTPENYVAYIEKLMQARKDRDDAFAEAQKHAGIKKAEFLVKALQSMDMKVVDTNYVATLKEIAVLDPDDTLHFTKPRLEAIAKATQQAELNRLIIDFSQKTLKPLKEAKDIDGIHQAFAKFAETNPQIPVNKIEGMKHDHFLTMYIQSGDEANAIATSEQYMAAHPDSPMAKNKEKAIAAIKEAVKRQKDKVQNEPAPAK